MSSSSSSSDSEHEVSNVQKSPSPASHRSGSGNNSDASSVPSHRSPVRRGNNVTMSDSDEEAPMPSARRSPSRDHESGSEKSGGEDSSPRKRRVQMSSDDDDDNDAGEKTTAQTADLFGEDMSSDSDDDDADAKPKVKADRERGGSDDDHDEDNDVRRGGSSDDEPTGIVMRPDSDEEPEDDKAPALIEAVCSKNDFDLGQENIPFIKLPNFLSLETKPFDPEFFSDSDEEQADEEGRHRLKLKVENTIRWRKVVDDEGNEKKESNAKVVKWSDGTMSLYLGSEIFDIQPQAMVDHNHLYLRQGAGLIGQRIFEQKWSFRPHSTDSKTHRKVTMTMAERTRKSAQVKMISEVGSNPEKIRADNARKEEEKLRQAIRAQFATTARGRKDRDGPRGYYGGGYGREDDEDPDSLSAIKRKYKDAPLIGASGSESEAEMTPKGDETSDSDEEFRRKKQQKKKMVVEDDSD